MNLTLRLVLVCFGFGLACGGRAATPAEKGVGDEVTRLQVFLDRANFGPGKIDGKFGGFTEKALGLYREAHGLAPLPAAASAKVEGKEEKGVALPELADMDLQSSVKEIFVEYTVTEADVKATGELPEKVPAMAKLKWLPYANVGEAVAERFHLDVDYLKELNPGKVEGLKAGDTVKVPNVEPFDVGGVKGLRLMDQVATKGGKKQKAAGTDALLTPEQIAIKVDTKDNMLRLFEKEKLVAAYPVTIGSAQTASPLGEWKVKGVALLPDFRYDLSFLKTGERGDKTYLLSPGPNNPVGMVWVALNKPGIGLHGTNDPDSIGRSASHGCVRLANWDIARLATHVRAGVVVSIH